MTLKSPYFQVSSSCNTIFSAKSLTILLERLIASSWNTELCNIFYIVRCISLQTLL